MSVLSIFLMLPWCFAHIMGLEERFSIKDHANITQGIREYTLTSLVAQTRSECALLCSSEFKCYSVVYNNDARTCDLLSFVPTTEQDKLKNGNSLLIKVFPKDRLYRDCQEAFLSGDIREGDVYTIKPSKEWDQKVQVVCMFESKYGWTVIQRRMDGTEDFYRDWLDYENGFGNRSGEYWVGLKAIYWLTRTNHHLSVHLQDHEGNHAVASYTKFYVEDSANNYRLHASGYYGTAGDSLQTHTGKMFSTRDADHDTSTTHNCAQTYRGAWWYRDCHDCNLNGIWYPSGKADVHAAGLSWDTWKSGYYSNRLVSMRVTRH